MDYLKITCGNCDKSFKLFWEQINHDEHISCPYCLRVCTSKSWENLVNAYMTMHDWNYQTLKAHEERGTSLFIAEFKHIRPKGDNK